MISGLNALISTQDIKMTCRQLAMGENGDNSERLSKVKARPRKCPSHTNHCQDVNGKCCICLAPGRADESPSALMHEQKYKQDIGIKA